MVIHHFFAQTHPPTDCWCLCSHFVKLISLFERRWWFVHPKPEPNWCRYNGTRTLVSNLVSITNAMGVSVLPPRGGAESVSFRCAIKSSAMYCQLIGRRVAIYPDILNIIIYPSDNIRNLLYFTLGHRQSLSKARVISERISIPQWDNQRLPIYRICW